MKIALSSSANVGERENTMNDETSRDGVLNLSELSDAEIGAMLSELPATRAEFFALALVDRQRIAEGQHRMRVRINLVAGPDGKIDDADFSSQVESLWAGVEASNGRGVVKSTIKRRRRRKSSKIPIRRVSETADGGV
jgi:hypothetical protein